MCTTEGDGTHADVMNCIKDFVALAFIAEIDNYYSESLSADNKLGAEEELDLEVTKSRSDVIDGENWWEKTLYYIYKVHRLIYSSFIFYYLPFLVIFLPWLMGAEAEAE